MQVIHERTMRTKSKLVPWITPAIKQLMRNSDYHKKKVIRFNNYTILRFDRNRFGGGVALYMKNNISSSEGKDLVPDNLEMLCIEITRQHSKPLLIAIGCVNNHVSKMVVLYCFLTEIHICYCVGSDSLFKFI